MNFKMYTIEVIGHGFLPNTDSCECGEDYVDHIAAAFLTTDRPMATVICNQICDDGFNAVVRTVDCTVQ